jgi:hypothetical protein
VRQDTLVVLIRDSLVLFHVASITRIETQHTRRKAPIIVGAVVGAVGGVVMGFSLAGTECLRGPVIDPCDATTELGAPLVGAVVGGFLGGALGSLLQGGRWQGIELSLRSTPRGHPTSFELGIGIPLRVARH